MGSGNGECSLLILQLEKRDRLRIHSPLNRRRDLTPERAIPRIETGYGRGIAN